ncbi:MAG: hypothetical protein HY521_14095 [Proteobacteria bacterium]|nr:hypothetical protein [Pseudomonadota bacterium]
MVTLIEPAGESACADLVIQTKRRLHNKSWWFELLVPRSFWEDLFQVNGPDGLQMTTRQAFERAKPFWAHLIERVADRLAAQASPGAPNRHLRKQWPDFASLEREYTQFGAQNI